MRQMVMNKKINYKFSVMATIISAIIDEFITTLISKFSLVVDDNHIFLHTQKFKVHTNLLAVKILFFLLILC